MLQDAVAARAVAAADHQRQLQRRRDRDVDQRRRVPTDVAASNVDVVRRRVDDRRRRRSDATEDSGRHFVDGRTETDPGQFRVDSESDLFRLCGLRPFPEKKSKSGKVPHPLESNIAFLWPFAYLWLLIVTAFKFYLLCRYFKVLLKNKIVKIE